MNSKNVRMVRGLKGFDDAVSGNCANTQAGRGLIHSLVMLAVDPKASPLKDALQVGVRFDSDFV